MGNACAIASHMSQNKIVSYLSSWPGTVLDWSEEDLLEFGSCFKARKVAAGKEVSL